MNQNVLIAGLASGLLMMVGACASKPATASASRPAPIVGRWSNVTQVTCVNTSDLVLTLRLLKNRHHPELGELAAITSGKGATLEVGMEMPAEAGVLVTSWNQEPALTPLTIPVQPTMINRIQVDVIEGRIVVKSVSVSPMP